MVNPVVSNVNHRNLAAGNNEYIEAILVSGQTVVKDQALGIVTASQKFKALVSADTLGGQLIRGFAAEDVDASGGDKNIRVLVGGKVDDSQIVFDGIDTLATVPATPAGQPDSYLTMLRDYGMSAINLDDHYIQDNQ